MKNLPSYYICVFLLVTLYAQTQSSWIKPANCLIDYQNKGCSDSAQTADWLGLDEIRAYFYNGEIVKFSFSGGGGSIPND